MDRVTNEEIRRKEFLTNSRIKETGMIRSCQKIRSIRGRRKREGHKNEVWNNKEKRRSLD